MTRIVIDASVATKWLVDEPDSNIARALGRPEWDPIAPDLIRVELAAAVWKKRRRGALNDEEAIAAVGLISGLPLQIEPSDGLVMGAYALASVHDRSVYDCLYVALALREECQLVTEGSRLYNALRMALPGRLVRLSDIVVPDFGEDSS